MECAVSLAKPSAVSWYEIPWWAGIQTSTILTIIFDSKSSICVSLSLFHNCNHAVTDLLITISIATVQSQKMYTDSLCCLYLQNLKWFTESSSPNTIPSDSHVTEVTFWQTALLSWYLSSSPKILNVLGPRLLHSLHNPQIHHTLIHQ